MAIGDYLSNMFLGNAYNQGQQNEGVKKGTDELWKIYQQAYNIKPIWNGKQWVIPSGAIQRFQMLLPLIQAQISGANQGRATTGKDGNNYGLLGGLFGGATKEIGNTLIKKNGGWEGILDKIGGGVKNLWNGIGSQDNYSSDFGYNPQETSDFDTAFSPQSMPDMTMPNIDMSATDTLPTGQDWNVGDIDYGNTDMSWLDNINYDTDWADVGYW